MEGILVWKIKIIEFLVGERVMKVIIAGSRDLPQDSDCHWLMNDYLDDILCREDCQSVWATEVVSGTANGADKFGEEWANRWGIPIKHFPADWKKYGKSAGYKRNKQMAEYAEVCVVFWNGESKGSKHMIQLALEYNLPLWVFTIKNQLF